MDRHWGSGFLLPLHDCHPFCPLWGTLNDHRQLSVDSQAPMQRQSLWLSPAAASLQPCSVDWILSFSWRPLAGPSTQCFRRLASGFSSISLTAPSRSSGKGRRCCFYKTPLSLHHYKDEQENILHNIPPVGKRKDSTKEEHRGLRRH